MYHGLARCLLLLSSVSGCGRSLTAVRWADRILEDFDFVRFRLGEPISAPHRLSSLAAVVGLLKASKSRGGGCQVPSALVEEETSIIQAQVPPGAAATFDERPAPNAWLPDGGIVVDGYDLRSTIGGILECEYQLYDVHQLDGSLAELRLPSGGYGGVTSLVRLAEAFGFDLLAVHTCGDVIARDDFRSDYVLR